jgi:hypothetical protein
MDDQHAACRPAVHPGAKPGPLHLHRSGKKISRGTEIRRVDFQERATPRIIRTVDGAAARGRFWIDAGSGRITETELFVDTGLDRGRRPRVVGALIHVVYAEQPRLHLWLPVSMNETYSGVGLIDGHATYSNFRRFGVATDEIIKAPSNEVFVRAGAVGRVAQGAPVTGGKLIWQSVLGGRPH